MMNTKLFSQELSFVSGCVEKKTTIPILSNILISQIKKAVTLTSTDLEVAAVSAFKGDAGKIRTTVGSKALTKAMASLKGVEDFDISADSKGIAIGANGFASTLGTMSPDTYPDLPTLPEDGGVHLPYRELSTMLSCSKHAVSTEISRFTLDGVLLDLGKHGLRVIATDGHRLCVVEHPMESEEASLKFIVMSRIIPLIAKMAKDGTCGIFTGKDHHFFVGSPAPGVSRVLLQRHVTGNFPGYERVMPKAFKFKAKVNREEFIRIAKQIVPMTDERSIAGKLTLENTLAKSALTIQSSVSEQGSAKATIGVDCGPGTFHGSVTVGFNLQYIIDALMAMKGCGDVTLCLNAPDQACEIDGTVDGISVREVIMPMRI